MQHTQFYTFTAFLSYSFLMFKVTHGALRDFPEELLTTGEMSGVLKTRFNHTEADYLQTWINIQVRVNTNTLTPLFTPNSLRDKYM